MREFKCAALGYRCSWHQIATEGLLLERIALHLRDAHGVPALDMELASRIQHLWTYVPRYREPSAA